MSFTYDDDETKKAAWRLLVRSAAEVGQSQLMNVPAVKAAFDAGWDAHKDALRRASDHIQSVGDRVSFWEAVNRYAISCGGDPDKHIFGNTTRQAAVVDVERAVASRVAVAIDDATGS